MKQLRNGARYVLLALVMLSGFLSATSASFAQGNATSFVSPMTGIPINTTGQWTIDTTSVFSQDGIESITLWGPTELASVWFLPANTPLVEARDIVLDSYAQTFGTFVEIDRGAYGNVSYSLDITNSEGIEFGVFSLFLGQRDSGYVEYYVFFGSLPLFAQGFASAQQNITVNNAPIFQGVDGAGLQTLLNQNAGVTGTASTTTQPQQPPQPQQPTTPQQPTQPQQPTEPQPTQPQQPTTGTTGTSPEGDAYLAALDAEMTYLQGTMSTFLANYTLLDETQAQELNRVGGEWGAYQQRAAGIVAPPGFETLDAEYRSIVTNVTNLGTLWQGVVTAVQNNDGTFSDKMVSLMLEVFIVEGQINEFKTQIQNQGTGTTTTQPTTGTTTEPTQPPADPGTTTTTTGLTPEQSAYLESIRGEVTRLQTSVSDFQTKFQSLADGTSPNTQQTAQEIATIIDMWLAMPQTALQFVAPAGMEDVDTAYKQLANDFSTTATTFNTAIQQQQASDPAAQTTIQTFLTQLDGLSASLTSLNSLLDQKAQSTQTTTTQQAPPPQPTPSDPGTTTTTTTTTTGAADGDAYIAALQTEMTDLQTSIDSFWTALESIQGADQATVDQANAKINEIVNYWATYQDVAAGITAPAGYEAVDAKYRQLASDVPLMTQFFVEFLETQDQAAKDQAQQNFIGTIESVEGQIASIQADLGGASTTTTTQQPSDPTGQTTTGTTTETPAETPATQGQGDVTETGNRGQLPNPGGNQGTTGSTGSTQGGDDAEDLGFVEEGLYVSPQFDVEVTWDDRFAYDPEYLDVTISSDEEEGADSITLVWDGGEGDITVTIIEPEDFDPADMVAYWESDDYLGGFEAGAEVLLADSSSDRGAALILVGDESDGAVIYREAMCIDRGCTQVALVMTISSIDDTADIIADAEEAVEIDGESATGVFSTREINRELP